MKIAFISQPEYFRFIYEHDLDFLGEVKEFPFNYSMLSGDFEELVRFNADVNFFFRGEYFPASILRKMSGVKVNLSSEPFPKYMDGKLYCTPDSINRFNIFKSVMNKPFDYIFHYDKASFPFIEEEGIKLSGEFCFPVATQVYHKLDCDKKWDFFFIGRSTAYRETFFSPLKHHYHFLHISHGVWGVDAVTYLNQSKIALNVHAENEISWEPRVQMMMATGNMVISQTLSANSYLIPGVDYVEVSNPEELHEAADYFIHHATERERIALNGQKKIIDLLDSRKVFPPFIIGIITGKYEKAGCDPQRKTGCFYSVNRTKSDDYCFSSKDEYIDHLKRQLDQKTVLLEELIASPIYKVSRTLTELLDKAFPRGSRRRNYLKVIGKRFSKRVRSS